MYQGLSHLQVVTGMVVSLGLGYSGTHSLGIIWIMLLQGFWQHRLGWGQRRMGPPGWRYLSRIGDTCRSNDMSMASWAVSDEQTFLCLPSTQPNRMLFWGCENADASPERERLTWPDNNNGIVCSCSQDIYIFPLRFSEHCRRSRKNIRAERQRDVKCYYAHGMTQPSQAWSQHTCGCLQLAYRSLSLSTTNLEWGRGV